MLLKLRSFSIFINLRKTEKASKHFQLIDHISQKKIELFICGFDESRELYIVNKIQQDHG